VVARVFSVVTYQPKANTEMNEWKKKTYILVINIFSPEQLAKHPLK